MRKKHSLDMTFREALARLEAGETVKIMGFGTLRPSTIRARKVDMTNLTGQMHYAPTSKTIRYRMSDTLRRTLNPE